MNQGTAQGRVLQAQRTARVKAGSKSEPGESEEFKAAHVTGRQSGGEARASGHAALTSLGYCFLPPEIWAASGGWGWSRCRRSL